MNQPEEIKLLPESLDLYFAVRTMIVYKNNLHQNQWFNLENAVNRFDAAKQAIENNKLLNTRTSDAATKELLKDKERLDWLQSKSCSITIDKVGDPITLTNLSYTYPAHSELGTLRTAIDNAMKGKK